MSSFPAPACRQTNGSQIGDNRLSTSWRVVEWHDHHCGDALVTLLLKYPHFATHAMCSIKALPVFISWLTIWWNWWHSAISVRQGLHHNGDQAARRPHIYLSIWAIFCSCLFVLAENNRSSSLLNFAFLTLIDKFFHTECIPQFLGKLCHHKKLWKHYSDSDFL